jgi:ribosomal protein S9
MSSEARAKGPSKAPRKDRKMNTTTSNKVFDLLERELLISELRSAARAAKTFDVIVPVQVYGSGTAAPNVRISRAKALEIIEHLIETSRPDYHTSITLESDLRMVFCG